MKLIDCFMYFDENLVLDIRLNTLNDAVDKFVIAEATRDHAGKSKKLNFKIENFSKFKHKIVYQVIDNLPLNVTSKKFRWHDNHMRDQFQRNSLAAGYKDADPNDLIMISDIDEIPDPKKIKEFDIKNKYACFLQKNFQSKINLLNITESYWSGTKICQKKNLKSPQWLRNIKTKKRSFLNIFKDRQPQLIEDGGWHFSFLKDPESIKRKIIAYSHQEYNKEEFTDIKNIENKISNNKDLFNRDIKYKSVEIDSSFPNYIYKNKSKFKDWIV
tara:strand:- start:8082 stop:8897 length:816 start_codon:yes stop_codon:yes gene_type:complete